MYKLKFELEQHTPIIHFQAKDAGATLRASEVKPKLDKFILTQIGKRFVNDPKVNEEECYKEGKKHLQKKDADARRVYEEEKKKGNKDAKLELCLIPGQEGALNYKLSFKLSSDAKVQYFLPMSSNPKDADTLKSHVQKKLGVQEVEILPLTSYFANEDKAKSEPTKKDGDTPKDIKDKERLFEKNWQKVQLATLVNTPVEGVMHFQNAGLREEVNNLITNFFMLHNFGARQSKGYGSFTIKSQGVANIRAVYKYSFDISSKDYKEVMNRINYFYKSLRSGINEYRRRGEQNRSILYFKSALHYYATTAEEKQWDKKSIKEYFFPQKLDEEKTKYKVKDISSKEKNDFRDLLGFSADEVWGKKYQVKKTCKKETDEGVKEFSRLKSPIQFKPIRFDKGFTVFFDVFPEYSGWDKFLGSEVSVEAFQVKKEDITGKEKDTTGKKNLIPLKEKPLTLKVPTDIDLKDVLKYIFSNIKPELRVTVKKGGEDIFDGIKAIYNKLQNELKENER
ncbi:hypothetical protein [Porphyromonas circumdentaria]|uniref:Uncharacterized protein n=1 Tax=Porphyromonas circumdentaria TaxID=29524 RepID=A0A1T4KE57_9PORP|nr:hypothetical protein [Porphyromonas circumdentaria]MBB6275083.1 hypothetical protein [Porphyromonas circumdentaria]SJZ40689.1 hypothetical protein SAMN02745171_00007 [Porphyromonas circumdentaria]